MSIKATSVGGDLQQLGECSVFIGSMEIPLYILPDISDAKSAEYNDEVIIGRTSPIKTYSHSANRQISIAITLLVRKHSDIKTNWQYIRAIQSAVYPRNPGGGSPYRPPVLCKLQCGELFKDMAGKTKKDYLCCVLKDYNLKYPKDVPWDEVTKLPYQVEISCNFDVVYKSEDLPGQENILPMSDALT